MKGLLSRSVLAIVTVALLGLSSAGSAQADTRVGCLGNPALSPFNARCASWTPVADISVGANSICGSQQEILCTTYSPSEHAWMDSVCSDASITSRTDPGWVCGSRAVRSQRCPIGSRLDVGSWVPDVAGNVDPSSLHCLGFPWTIINGYTSARLHLQVAGTPACRTNTSTDALADTSSLPLTVAGGFQLADAVNGETFVAGADGRVYHSFRNPSGAWSTWDTLSGPGSGIFGSVRNGKNYLDQQELYVRANNGQVYHLYATPGKGSGWKGWDTMGAPTSPISGDVFEGTNYLHNQELYVLGADGNVYHKFSTPRVGSGWSNWDSLGHPKGVTVTGDVQLGINFECNQEIYVTGTDGFIYHSFSTPGQGSGWSAWDSLGRPDVGVRGSVSAGENDAGNQELYVIGMDNRVYHDYATPGVGSGWSGWSDLGSPGGAVTSTSVFVDTFPVEKLTVFTDTGEYSNTADAGVGSGWTGWTKVVSPCPSGGSSTGTSTCRLQGGSTDAILATIRTLESGGNYQAQSPGSAASGAYQFVDSTWNGYGGYLRAADAPPAVQDAKAAALVTSILAANGGDVGTVPVVWYIGHVPLPTSPEWDAVPAGNRVTPREYQALWMATYRSLVGGP